VKTLEKIAKNAPRLTHVQQYEIKSVVATYSKVMDPSEAREYIHNIVKAGRLMAAKEQWNVRNVVDNLIEEMRNIYFSEVVPNFDRAGAAKIFLNNLHDMILAYTKLDRKEKRIPMYEILSN